MPSSETGIDGNPSMHPATLFKPGVDSKMLLLSSSLQLSEVSDLWFLLCHLTKLQHGAAQRSLTIWQIWAPPLYPKETGFWLHGHLNRHAKADAQTERKWKREWALHLRAVGEEFEQCLPRGVIFYSLCPSVAWPGALGLTVSALNTADTDSSELQHTWDEGGGWKRTNEAKIEKGRVSGRHLRALCTTRTLPFHPHVRDLCVRAFVGWAARFESRPSNSISPSLHLLRSPASTFI